MERLVTSGTRSHPNRHLSRAAIAALPPGVLCSTGMTLPLVSRLLPWCMLQDDCLGPPDCRRSPAVSQVLRFSDCLRSSGCISSKWRLEIAISFVQTVLLTEWSHSICHRHFPCVMGRGLVGLFSVNEYPPCAATLKLLGGVWSLCCQSVQTCRGTWHFRRFAAHGF